MPRDRRSTSVIACCSLAYGNMRQPPKAGPSVVSWIAISARRPLVVSCEQQRLMAVVVGVTEHLSPCRRRAADEDSFSNLGGPTQVAESSCRAQPHIRWRPLYGISGLQL